MVFFIILVVMGFAAPLYIIEIPKLLKAKKFMELWAFSLLLTLGVVLSILKSLKVEIGNPSDLLAWIYSPLEPIMKFLLQKG